MGVSRNQGCLYRPEYIYTYTSVLRSHALQDVGGKASTRHMLHTTFASWLGHCLRTRSVEV
eukprot:1356166-Amphidinium_carterae.1